MSEFAYPLNGEQNYTAEQAGAFFATRGSGVWSGEDNLAVSVSGARMLSLSAGIAWFTTDKTWGKVYVNTAPVEFELPVADGVLDCICRIVVRWNKTQNEAKAIMLQGELASEAVAPLRSTTDEIYDLVLADYLVVHGETEASAANLTDQRLNEDLCGLMRDSVTSIPTAQLQAQAQALMDELRNVIDGIERGSEVMLKTVYDPDDDGEITHAYDVGDVFISFSEVSPAERFGGDWEQIKDVFLLAAGDTYVVGDTGGEAEHTLTVDEMPSHTHAATQLSYYWDNNQKWGAVANTHYEGYDNASSSTGATGGSAPHNNMPPYIAVYMWRRVA